MDIIFFKGIVAAMRYGQYGREDGALAILYKKKGLDIKIISRKFEFSVNNFSIIISNVFCLIIYALYLNIINFKLIIFIWISNILEKHKIKVNLIKMII